LSSGSPLPERTSDLGRSIKQRERRGWARSSRAAGSGRKRNDSFQAGKSGKLPLAGGRPADLFRSARLVDEPDLIAFRGAEVPDRVVAVALVEDEDVGAAMEILEDSAAAELCRPRPDPGACRCPLRRRAVIAEPALDILIAGIAAEELRRRGRSDSAEAFTTLAPCAPGQKAAKALRESRASFVASPLGDNGRGSRRRSLTFALPNARTCPDAHESDRGEKNKRYLFHFEDPGQVLDPHH
jgi:hypothetical protein